MKPIKGCDLLAYNIKVILLLQVYISFFDFLGVRINRYFNLKKPFLYKSKPQGPSLSTKSLIQRNPFSAMELETLSLLTKSPTSKKLFLYEFRAPLSTKSSTQRNPSSLSDFPQMSSLGSGPSLLQTQSPLSTKQSLLGFHQTQCLTK